MTRSGRIDNPTSSTSSLVGGDSSIPFFRYPDPADLAPESWYVPPLRSGTASEASLRSDFVLGQDEYGADTILSLGGTRFPIPKLAVGRLVETAADATAMLDAYLNPDNTVKTVAPGHLARHRATSSSRTRPMLSGPSSSSERT